jgi:hypothetical protein
MVAVEPTDWLSDVEQRVWRRLLSVDCRLRERLDHELQADSGLTLGEYDVLVHLSEAPGRALRMSDLAERLLLSRSGLTRRIDGLVKAGWWLAGRAMTTAGGRWPSSPRPAGSCSSGPPPATSPGSGATCSGR